MAELRKTRSLEGIAVATGTTGLVVVIGYVYRLQSISPVEPSSVPCAGRESIGKPGRWQPSLVQWTAAAGQRFGV